MPTAVVASQPHGSRADALLFGNTSDLRTADKLYLQRLRAAIRVGGAAAGGNALALRVGLPRARVLPSRPSTRLDAPSTCCFRCAPDRLMLAG